MFILLIGPKGSGKSHIGRVLERHLGVCFFHVEPHWMEYYAECSAAGRAPEIPEGIARVHPLILQALDTHEHVCVETTGASGEILDSLRNIVPRSELLLARIRVPLELCLDRIASRDPAHQIPMDTPSIRQVYELSNGVELESDLELDNTCLTEEDIVSAFRKSLQQP